MPAYHTCNHSNTQIILPKSHRISAKTETETEADADAEAAAWLPLKLSSSPTKVGHSTAIKLSEQMRSIGRIVPWFVVTNCIVQIFLFHIATDRLRHYLMFIPELHRQPWRYISYTLLHADRAHLLLNVCLQLLIGQCLELEQGHFRIAIVYAVGAISGSMATLLLQPHLSLLGASAGIYALLTSHVPHLFKNFPQLKHRYFRITAVLLLCLSDATFTAYHYLVNHNEHPRICLEAHVAGGVAGLVCGALLYRAEVTHNSCGG